MTDEKVHIPSQPAKISEGISFFQDEVSFEPGKHQVMCMSSEKKVAAIFPSKKKAEEFIMKKHPGRYKPSYVESALSRALNNPKTFVFNHYWRYLKP